MRLLITGATGNLGGYLLPAAHHRGWDVIAWAGRSGPGPALAVDLAQPADLAAAFHAARPDAVIHAAALAHLATCESQPGLAERINVTATRRLAELAAARGTRFVFCSTDLVFDGTAAPYGPTAVPRPLSVYGRTKAAAEQAVADALPAAVIARLSWLAGPNRNPARPNFLDQQIAQLRRGVPVALFTDEYRTPIDLATAAAALLALAESSVAGIWHVAGPERLSRFDMGRVLARSLGVAEELVRPDSAAASLGGNLRPRDVALDARAWRQQFPAIPWPTLAEALPRLLGRST